MEAFLKPAAVTILAGHYGSGKTNLAINYSLYLACAKPRGRVAVCDLDIVNPYFRTADFSGLLARQGIRLITSPFANTNVDHPAVPPGVQAIFDEAGLFSVVDLGGDGQGALALGRYASQLAAVPYDMWLVVNAFRPLTRGAEEIHEIKNDIEQAAGAKFTALVNNSNLGAETTAADIAGSFPFMEALSREMNLPWLMTAVRRDLCRHPQIMERPAVFPIDLYEKTLWKVK